MKPKVALVQCRQYDDVRAGIARALELSNLGAELRDKRNQVIPGFGKEQCVMMGLDEIAHPLRWEGRSAGALAGQTVRLRFYFRNAHIYQVRSEF